MKTVYFFQSQYSEKYSDYIQYWLPYTAGCLWAYAKNKVTGWKLGGIQFARDNIDEYIQSIEHIDLACFCTYVWNKEYNIKLAKEIKKNFPHCHISFGGPQVTVEYLTFSDSICLNEGETNLVSLMEDISNNLDTQKVYKNSRMPSLQNVPSPYATGVFDDIITNNPEAKWSAVFETNRGCPYSCTFCEWGTGLTGSKIFQFDMKRIQAELEWFAKNPITTMFLADANFGIFKDRDLEIAKLIRKTLSNSSLEYLSMNYAKNSNARIFEIAKILGPLTKGITLSAQSMNSDTLTAIKRQNMKINNFTEMLNLADKYNIETYTEMILGLPFETKESWKKGITDLMELGQHNRVYTQLGNVLPNTEWNTVHREKHNIKTVKMKKFCKEEAYANEPDEEFTDFIVSTDTMSKKDMHESYMYSWVCDQMHYKGYSQIIARWLNVKHNISYKSYYDSMFTMISNSPQINKEFQRISNAFLELLNYGSISDTEISPYNLEFISRQIFFEMIDTCIAFAVRVGNNFVEIPSNVIEIQKRFIKNDMFLVPYEADLDVNLETKKFENTTYKFLKTTSHNNFSNNANGTARGNVIQKNKLILV